MLCCQPNSYDHRMLELELKIISNIHIYQVLLNGNVLPILCYTNIFLMHYTDIICKWKNARRLWMGADFFCWDVQCKRSHRVIGLCISQDSLTSQNSGNASICVHRKVCWGDSQDIVQIIQQWLAMSGKTLNLVVVQCHQADCLQHMLKSRASLQCQWGNGCASQARTSRQRAKAPFFYVLI